MSHLIRLTEAGPAVAEAQLWPHIDDDQAVPEGRARVSLARYLASPELRADASVGLTIAPEDDVRTLVDVAERPPLIAIAFPAFGDGRGYTHARILRDELGYTGPVRATGDVLHDQLWHLARCGFDEFELRADKDPHYAVERAFSTWSEVYVAASDDRAAVLNRSI